MQPIALTYRGDLVDFSHYGDIAVVDSDGKLIYSFGDPYKVAYARSSAKLFQILPVFMSGAIDEYKMTNKEIAIMCSSHNGEEAHRATILGILEKIGLTKEDLKCGIDYPLHEPLAIQMKAKGEIPNTLFGDCSGKHSGMLMTAKILGEDLTNYYKPNHPVQQRINKVVADVCEIEEDKIIMGLDGCGVPVHAMPLYNFAYGFAKLSRPEKSEKYGEYFKRITTSIAQNPFMLGGTDCLCTDLPKATNGRIIGKRGAGGYWAAVDLESGLGFAMKVNEDTDLKYFLFLEVLKQLNLISQEELDKLTLYTNDTITNNNDEVASVLKPTFTLTKHD